jgi:hypothetical protein
VFRSTARPPTVVGVPTGGQAEPLLAVDDFGPAGDGPRVTAARSPITAAGWQRCRVDQRAHGVAAEALRPCAV